MRAWKPGVGFQGFAAEGSGFVEALAFIVGLTEDEIGLGRRGGGEELFERLASLIGLLQFEVADSQHIE